MKMNMADESKPAGFSVGTLNIRPMQEDDLDQVVRNEVAAYEYPWNRRIFADCLKSGYLCRVMVNEQEIVAHGVMSVAIGECHLLTLCVRPDYQRAGIGRHLFRLLLDQAYEEDARICFLEVRRSNKPAVALYRTLGFVRVGERKNYYPDEKQRENAMIMSCKLPLTAINPDDLPVIT